MERNARQLTRDVYAAFNRGDVSGVLRHVDAGFQWRMSDQFARATRVFDGHEGILEAWQIFRESLEDVRCEPLALHDDGAGVVAQVHISGRLRNTEERHEVDLVQVWTIRNGLAVRLDGYSTLQEACDATGMTPPAETSASASAEASGRANR
jgi:ketosteroid isomerase-like protein